MQTKYLMGAMLLAMTTMASAHSPSMQCSYTSDKKDEITCKGGFSDGSSAFGVDVSVMDFDDEVIVKGKFDKESNFTFKTPKEDFYVKFDGGPGHELELNSSDIEVKK